MKKIVLLLATISLIAVSCERNNNSAESAEIILSHYGIYSGYLGTSEIIKITSNIDYDVIVDDNCDWLLVQQLNGGIKVTILPYYTGNYSRQAEINISNLSYNISQSIQVSQNAIPASQTITYTSTDNQVVKPYDANAFNSKIIYNSCINGTGRICFEKKLTTIKASAFEKCTNLSSVDLSLAPITSIGDYAFYMCTQLSKIVIGRSIQEIGSFAFYNVAVSKGTYIYATTPPKKETGNFEYDNGRYKTGAIYVPSGSVSIYQEAWPNYNIKAM